ncbi:hypothetical protein EcWSU1_00014 [Enterobacter ludwigii]|uniref:Uncharacterized protein n=1 Tax=Enterobacter ludwigii TaxID=299767 RepID=G8LET1_9ENTR|nr:hypothetical protein EcWSU1_00014 [Enterobacter ludwigii]
MFHGVTLMRSYRIRVKHCGELAYTFDVTHQQDVGERTEQGHRGDIDQCRAKAIVLSQITDDQRNRDPPQSTDKVEHAAGQTNQAHRGQRGDQRPGDGGKTVTEERNRHQRHNPDRIVGVVCAHDAGGDQQPADNRRFTRDTQREPFFHQPVRQPAGKQHTKEGRKERYGGHKARLQRGDAFFLGQIVREPGQEEPQRGGHRELPQINPHQLAVENQLPVGFGQRLTRFFFHRRIAIHQAATVADIVQFSFADTFGETRRLIDLEPDQRPDNADPPGHNKDPMPAQQFLDPDQQRRQECQADKLPGGVEPNGRGAFMLREPAGHHAVIGRKRRGFENPGDRTQANQRHQPGGKALEQGRHRPAEDGNEIGQARADAVKEPAAGDLAQRIQPGKRRKDVAHFRFADPKLLLNMG